MTYIVIDGNAQDVVRDAESVLYYTGSRERTWSIYPEAAKRFGTAEAACVVARDLMRDYLDHYGPEDAGHVVAVALEQEWSEWGGPFWVASEL